MPGMYKSVGDGFKQIKATEGMRGFTLVSNCCADTEGPSLCSFYQNLMNLFLGMGSNSCRIFHAGIR